MLTAVLVNALLVLSVTLIVTDAFSQKGEQPTRLTDLALRASSRREILEKSGSIALSTLLTGLPVSAAQTTPRTIVVTGSNSGIGFEACKRLASQGNNLVLACRTIEKARDAASRLEEYGGNLIPAECDMASLKSIDTFANNLKSLIGNSSVDALCLNAGIARNTAAQDCARTSDGFELTGEST